MQTRYIADLHLYDGYSRGWREYLNLDLDGYAFYLIQNWNSVTEEDDIVIIAGDVGHYCPRTLQTLKQLKGHKILVIGNHDLTWGSELYNPSIFEGTHNFILRNDLYITHQPEIDDAIRSKVSYIIHGHHHRYDMPNMQIELRHYYCDVHRYNCAADLIGHKPRTLQELMLQKELLLDRYKEQGLIGGY